MIGVRKLHTCNNTTLYRVLQSFAPAGAWWGNTGTVFIRSCFGYWKCNRAAKTGPIVNSKWFCGVSYCQPHVKDFRGRQTATREEGHWLIWIVPSTKPLAEAGEQNSELEGRRILVKTREREARSFEGSWVTRVNPYCSIISQGYSFSCQYKTFESLMHTTKSSWSDDKWLRVMRPNI